jgi:Zn-dependent M28 family amino/carboxypeptidase
MRRPAVLLRAALVVVAIALVDPVAPRAAAPLAVALHDAFDAPRAFDYTSTIAGYGERWPGSPGHARTEALIRRVLQRDGAAISSDRFTATTPRGPVPVETIIGTFNAGPDPAQGIVMLAGHYDTLFTKGFIGANDGASSTGILLAFADALAHGAKTTLQVRLVWTDLEEAIAAFQGNDGLYGSRHLAAQLAADGTARRVRAFFLLDMIGDADLGVARETASTRWLQDFITTAAADLGYGRYFFQYDVGIIDDHVPFLRAGIPAVDVVDARYGAMGPGQDGMGAWHHSTADTMDKVSAHSLAIVGRTMLRTVELLDARE